MRVIVQFKGFSPWLTMDLRVADLADVLAARFVPLAWPEDDEENVDIVQEWWNEFGALPVGEAFSDLGSRTVLVNADHIEWLRPYSGQQAFSAKPFNRSAREAD